MESFKFDKIGKKMPYRVPDNFFNDVENDIIEKVYIRQRKRKTFKIFVAGIAATLALFIIVGNPVSVDHKTDFNEIDMAFDNLSDDDQTYLLEIIQDDIFINE